MRADVALVALLALEVALAAAGSHAHADVTALVAADTYLATEPGSLADDSADVAWSAHLEWRDHGARARATREAVVDFVERESLVGGTPRRELHELAYTDRSRGHLVWTLGRFRVPGGFWLMTDGAAVGGRWATTELAVFGGSRSFTNARIDTLLTAHPKPLPLAGASFTTGRDLRASVAYTLTADRVTFYRGATMGHDVLATVREPEQFLDAEVLGAIGEHAYLTAGATAGSRYLVTYAGDARTVTANPELENVWFGSQALYAALDVQRGRWRWDGAVAALRTKLGQQASVPTPELAAISGSFVEGTARGAYRAGERLRAALRYRLRAWASGGTAQRVQLVARWRAGVLVADASMGLDIHHRDGGAVGFVDSTTLLYRASVGAKTSRSEVAVGAAATSSLGDEVTLGPGSDGPTEHGQHAPYTLEARTYGFADAFVTHGPWFGGVDLEVNLRGDGVRMLAQVGWSR